MTASVLDGVRDLLPTLRERAEETERLRVVPEASIKDLEASGFFRLLPYAFSNWAVARVNARDRRPAVFYFHPWEIDPDQPRVTSAPWRSRTRHYTNLSSMQHKLLKLLRQHKWGRTDEVATTERSRLA